MRSCRAGLKCLLPRGANGKLFYRMTSHLHFRLSRPVASTFLLLLSLACSALLARAQSTTPEFRGFWVDSWGSELWTAPAISNVIRTTRSANMNALVVQMRRRGDALYNSHYEPKCKDIAANFDPLAELIARAKDTNGPAVEVHAWMVTYHIYKGSTPPASQPTHPLKLHPDWLLKDINGNTVINGEYTFDPGHPEVQKHTFNVAMDIITNYMVDGLNFDYIRYSSASEGYNDVTVARFNRLFNRTGVPATGDALWKQFRRDQVTSLLRKVYLHAITYRPEVKISCDTITWAPGPTDDQTWYNSSAAWNSIMQDWRGWMEEGILDINMPMNYFRQHTHPQDYLNWLNFAKDRKFNRHLVNGPGIYLNYTSNAIAQMRMSRDLSPGGNRAEGVCGYSYKVTNNEGVSRADFINSLVALSEYDPVMPPMFGKPVPTPTMPWKTAPTRGHLKGFVFGDSPANALDGAVVILTGPSSRAQTNDATGFYGFVDLTPGTYTVSATFPGYLPTTNQVSVSVGQVQTADISLMLIRAPVIIQEPLSTNGYIGSNVTFNVTANGTQPLSYQWRFEGLDLPQGTNSWLTLGQLSTNSTGSYDVVITNNYGSVTSTVAVLQVVPPPPPSRVGVIWHLAPQTRPYLTVNSLPLERGLAYNKATDRLLIVSRSGPHVYALNSQTGSDLHELNVTGVVGGTYPLLMVGAADDGAVYAANLTTDGSTSPFRLYRWANDSADTTPTLAYSGNPTPGISLRWGDTLDVRGSGSGTQVLIGSRQGTNAVVFTTTDGTTFTANSVSITGAAGGDFGLGIAFAEGDTFWGKANGRSLRQFSYDLAVGTGAVLRAHGSPGVPNAVSPIGYSPDLKMLAGINVSSVNHVRVYEIPVGSETPVLIATNAFATDNDNTSAGTGAVDFGGDRLFALDSNNGLMAMTIARPPTISIAPHDLDIYQGAQALLSVENGGSLPFGYQWWFNNAPLVEATNSTLTRAPALAAHSGLYFVVVTNVAGAVTSSPAELLVRIPQTPAFSQLVMPADGPISIKGAGSPGQYVIEFSENLVDWQELITIPSTDGSFNYWDPESSRTRRFYRVHWEP